MVISISMSDVFQRAEYTIKYEFRRIRSAVETFLFMPTRQLVKEQQVWWNEQDCTWCSKWRRTQTPTKARFSLKCRNFSRCKRQCNFNDVHKETTAVFIAPLHKTQNHSIHVYRCALHPTLSKSGQKCRQHGQKIICAIQYTSAAGTRLPATLRAAHWH